MIMALIVGDVFRTISMLVQSSTSLAHGQITSASKLCQAGGFFFQFGIAMNGKTTFSKTTGLSNHLLDWSVLALAVHGTLQILRPAANSIHHADVMFKYRHIIYAMLVIIPTLCASLAFIEPNIHYTSAGAYCQLPIRPLWYRLALSWIPRYVISITILGLSVAVYVHVRNVYSGAMHSKWWALSSIAIPKDKVETQEPQDSFAVKSLIAEARQRFSSSQTVPDSTLVDPSQGWHVSAGQSTMSSNHGRLSNFGISSDQFNMHGRPGERRRSTLAPITAGSIMGPQMSGTYPLDVPVEEPEEIEDPQPHPATIPPISARPPLKRLSSAMSGFSARTGSLREKASISSRVPLPAPIRRSREMSTPSALQIQRAIIRRQLRLTFIYPLVYLLMWLAPFVLNCMQYSNYYAKQPPFSLGVITNVCYALMAAIDCAIFCYRERPWRHIPSNTSRSFWTSFCCWKTGRAESGNAFVSTESKSGRWGSWDERGTSQPSGRGRQRRGSSLDSGLEVSPSAIFEETSQQHTRTSVLQATSSTQRSSTEQNNLSTQPDAEEQTTWQRLSAFGGRMASAVAGAPKATTRHGQKSIMAYLKRSRRSDGQRAADEHARQRLAQEMQERKDGEEQRLSAEGAGDPAMTDERHWWDKVRKDSEFIDWGGQRRNMLRRTKTSDSSETNSPGRSIEEGTKCLDIPESSSTASHSLELEQTAHGNGLVDCQGEEENEYKA